MYTTYLNRALDSLFRPIADKGFWDETNKRIAERLYHTQDWQWSHKPSEEMRYLVFCLSNILLAKDIFGLNTSAYDEKIKLSILYINNNRSKLSVSDLTYGALTTIYLQDKYYALKEINFKEWDTLLENAIDLSLTRKDNHDSLVLIAGKYALRRSNTEKIKVKLKQLTDNYLRSQNETGYFETGDIRGNYHQRNMYTIWGLMAAVEYYPEKKQELKQSAKRTIEWVWRDRREKADDAFLWHPPMYWIKNKLGFKIPIFNSEHSKYLFECHQTFFCNAINFYQKEFSTNDYENEKKLSFDWMVAHNRINKNLVDITGIDVPIRIMHTDGRLFIKNQNFKGIYEIGSYIMALAAFNQN